MTGLCLVVAFVGLCLAAWLIRRSRIRRRHGPTFCICPTCRGRREHARIAAALHIHNTNRRG